MSGIVREAFIAGCRVIQGDALEILPLLKGQAHCVITDVPYELTSGGNAGGSMKGKFAQEAYDNSGALMDLVEWGKIGGPIYRACRQNADAYIMSNDKHVGAAISSGLGAGFKYHNQLVWLKESPTRNRWYMKNCEYTQYFWKGKARVITNPGSKQLFACRRPNEDGHATAKPVPLMAHYISNSVDAGAVVLDPFVGSGTTLLAAAMLGCHGIGIEINPDYFDLTCARLREIEANGTEALYDEWQRVEQAQSIQLAA